MRFELNSRPDDIVLVAPDGSMIALKHQLLTSTERMTVLEMIDDSIASSMSYLFDKVYGWEGVEDESGNPLPLQRMNDGKIASNIDKVFARLGFAISIEAWIKQLVLNGVPLDKLMAMAEKSLNPEQLESVRGVAEKMGKAPAPTGGALSAN